MVKLIGPAAGRPAGPAGAGTTPCRPAAREEIGPALALVLGSAGLPADAARVSDFADYARRRGIDLSEVWVAVSGGALAWAVLPILSPGRTMLVLGPAAAPRHPDAFQAAGALLDTVCTHFGGRGVQLAQALLDPEDAAVHGLYRARGFEPVAQLLYLQVAPRRKAPPPALPAGMRWVGYGPDTHALFAHTIARTYEQSLDCPRLNGLRAMEDVLAGHRASGEFDPALWTLLCDGDEPLGALLLARSAPADAVELVYLGLTPPARGRRLGDLLMRQALASTAAAGGRLSLAVDSANVPALKLYYRHGMEQVGAKLATMRQLVSQVR